MPFRRKSRTRVTLGKEPRKMSRTVLQNIVVGTPQLATVAESTIGADVSGTGDVFENADTQKLVSPNAVVKFINIRLQYSMKPETAPANPGWMEYALILHKEEDAIPALNSGITANLGTQTVGDTCNNLYRGKCIWNGAVPISTEIPQVVDLKIKMPRKYCKFERGMYIQLVHAYRSNDSTDTTTTIRSIYSHQYKVYS